MPDLTITSIQLITKINAVTILLGETCVPFDFVQKVGSKYMLCIATDPTLYTPSHILLQGGDDASYVVALPLISSYTVGGVTLIAGEQYVVSATTPGKAAPKSDLTTGQFLTDIFKGNTAAIGDFLVEATGIGVA